MPVLSSPMAVFVAGVTTVSFRPANLVLPIPTLGWQFRVLPVQQPWHPADSIVAQSLRVEQLTVGARTTRGSWARGPQDLRQQFHSVCRTSRERPPLQLVISTHVPLSRVGKRAAGELRTVVSWAMDRAGARGRLLILESAHRRLSRRVMAILSLALCRFRRATITHVR